MVFFSNHLFLCPRFLFATAASSPLSPPSILPLTPSHLLRPLSSLLSLPHHYLIQSSHLSSHPITFSSIPPSPPLYPFLSSSILPSPSLSYLVSLIPPLPSLPLHPCLPIPSLPSSIRYSSHPLSPSLSVTWGRQFCQESALFTASLRSCLHYRSAGLL